MRKQFIPKMSNETNGLSQRRFPRRPVIVAWLSFILLLASLGASAAQEKPTAASPEVVNALIRLLTTGSDPTERVHAAEVLGQFGDRRATKPLIAALHDTDTGVQKAAALSLGLLRDRSAVPALLELLGSATDPSVKGRTAFALGLIKDRRAVEPLIQALKDSNEGVRTNSAIALGRLGDPRAVEPLLSLPHDKKHETCAPIAMALGQLKSERAVQALIGWLNDENPDICQNAAIALVLSGGNHQVEPLIKALDSQKPLIRRSAAFALGLLNDKRSVVPLITRLQDPKKRVAVSILRLKRAVICWIKDPGDGFDPAQLEHAAVNNPIDDPLRHVALREEKGLRAGGFGILMTKQLVDDLVYNERHNELMFVKFLP